MFSETLLMSGWTLCADTLPEQEETARREGFSLPGALSLKEFSDLLGMDEEAQEEKTEERRGIRFSLPGMLPQGTRGEATLSRFIDFGRLSGKRASLEIDHLCGTGDILLGEKKLLSFSGGMQVSVDVSDALRLRRRQKLTIRFDDAQQAGVFGTALVHTVDGACFKTVHLSPDAARQILAVEAVIFVQTPGEYALRTAIAGTQEETPTPWRETRVRTDHPGTQTVQFSLSMRAPCFEAGKPYTPPVLKLSLYILPKGAKGQGMLSDARTMMTGYPGETPDAYVPLTPEECALAPDELIAQAKRLRVHALSVPERAGSLLFRRAALEGICLLVDAPADAPALQSPCAVKKTGGREIPVLSRAAACWQLCGMPAMPPIPDAHASDRELLLDAAGREIELSEQSKHTMEQLRGLTIRLRAEAARQGQYTGALCAPGEWREDAVAEAIAAAFEPMHLSVLPLRGAWWAQSFFSATLQAFIPEDERNGAYSAEAELLGEGGACIASFSRDVSHAEGPLGIIEGRLPDRACVLTLRTRLRRSGAVVKTQDFPVYVGVRGPLEAAFSM